MNFKNKFTLNRKEKIDQRDIYRWLSVNIRYNSFKKKLKIVNITSAVKSEGVSTVSINLANVSSNQYDKVLLIDFNLNDSKIHELMKSSNSGILFSRLSEGNLNEINYDIFPTITTTDNNIIYILSVGNDKTNFTSFFHNKLFESFLDRLRELFDFIIFDCPPVLDCPEVISLSNISDGTVLVVSQREAKINNTQAAVKELRRGGAEILGVVFNKVID